MGLGDVYKRQGGDGAGGGVAGNVTIVATSAAAAAAAPRNGSGDGGRARKSGRAASEGEPARAETTAGCLRRGQVDILTARLGFSFCLAEKTLEGDGKRMTRRNRVRSKGAGGRAKVIGQRGPAPPQALPTTIAPS